MVVVLHHVCRCRFLCASASVANIFIFEHGATEDYAFVTRALLHNDRKHCVLKRVDHNFLRKSVDGGGDEN